MTAPVRPTSFQAQLRIFSGSDNILGSEDNQDSWLPVFKDVQGSDNIHNTVISCSLTSRPGSVAEVTFRDRVVASRVTFDDLGVTDADVVYAKIVAPRSDPLGVFQQDFGGPSRADSYWGEEDDEVAAMHHEFDRPEAEPYSPSQGSMASMDTYEPPDIHNNRYLPSAPPSEASAESVLESKKLIEVMTGKGSVNLYDRSRSTGRNSRPNSPSHGRRDGRPQRDGEGEVFTTPDDWEKKVIHEPQRDGCNMCMGDMADECAIM